MPKGGLGKGLDALLSDSFAEESKGIREIPVAEVADNPYQPRKKVDPKGLKELAASLKTQGILQPIVVRGRDGSYELVAGGRRLAAAKAAGLARIPAIVRDVTDKEAVEIALTENLQREDLNPLEEAGTYELMRKKFGYSQESIAQRVGKDRSTVANALRLLSLPAQVRKGLEDGSINAGHARALLSLPTDRARVALYRQIIARGLSVREVEGLAGTVELKPKKKGGKTRPAYMAELEDRFRRKLGTKVKISGQGRKGRIVISYSSEDELDRLARTIGV